MHELEKLGTVIALSWKLQQLLNPPQPRTSDWRVLQKLLLDGLNEAVHLASPKLDLPGLEGVVEVLGRFL